MSEFEDQQPKNNRGIFAYLKKTRRYWLIPIIIASIIVALLIGLGSSVLAPFLYPLF